MGFVVVPFDLSANLALLSDCVAVEFLNDLVEPVLLLCIISTSSSSSESSSVIESV